MQLHISQEIFDKIRYTCQQIYEVEWSGVLFYKLNGSMRDKANLSIDILDIFLMDKGTATYTSYEFDADVADFHMNKIMEDPEVWGFAKVGHIHSHNKMRVFFSGTDDDELHENSLVHNFYLSLIVNNFMEMTALVASIGSTPNYTYKTKDENGEEFDVSFSIKNDDQVLLKYECDIHTPQVKVEIEDTYKERLTKVVELSANRAAAAAAKLAEEKKYLPQPSQQKFNQQQQEQYNQFHSGNGGGTKTGWGKGSEDIYPNGKSSLKLASKEEVLVTQDEQFAAYVLRYSVSVPDDDLVSALDDLAEQTQYGAGMEVASFIVDKFIDWYDEFFELRPGTTETSMEDFIDATDTFLEHIEEYEDNPAYAHFIHDVISMMKQFGNQLQNLEVIS